MPVPKRKHPRWRRDQRRANIKLKSNVSMKCSHCGEPVLPHRVCKACGYYRNVLVVAKS